MLHYDVVQGAALLRVQAVVRASFGVVEADFEVSQSIERLRGQPGWMIGVRTIQVGCHDSGIQLDDVESRGNELNEGPRSVGQVNGRSGAPPIRDRALRVVAARLRHAFSVRPRRSLLVLRLRASHWHPVYLPLTRLMV
jgi:hypothetical protein